MLHVFFGTDTVGVREKAHAFIGKREAKGVSVERITAEDFEPGRLEEAAGSTSLFGSTPLYIIDMPSDDASFFKNVFNILDLFAGSPNTFVLIEGALKAAEKNALKKSGAEMTEVVGGKAERFNTFALADALLRKDKRSLWLLLMRARREGLSEEEIIGTLYWQIKTLRLASRAKSAAEAGLKDFAFSKAQRALGKFSGEEIDTLSKQLLSIYHDGHAGVRDIDIALERWTLTV